MNKVLIGIGVVAVAGAALWLTKPNTDSVSAVLPNSSVVSSTVNQPEKDAPPEAAKVGKPSLAVRIADNDTYIDPESVASLNTENREPIHLGEYIDPDKFVAKQNTGTPVNIGETIEDPWNHVNKTVATEVREIGEPIPDPEAWIQQQVRARNNGETREIGRYIDPDDIDQ